MFLEQCGQIFFSRMRLPFFFLLILLPWILVGCLLVFQKNQTEELEEKFRRAALKGKSALERKLRKESFLQTYSNSDPYFLDRQIEPFVFLEKEKERLEFLLCHPALPQKEAIQSRLAFLKSADNRLSFREENIRTTSQIKETEEKQRHPVQLDKKDLEKLLSRIENCPIGSFLPAEQSPQLLVRDLKLRQIKTPLQTEVFELELELLNREFLK